MIFFAQKQHNKYQRLDAAPSGTNNVAVRRVHDTSWYGVFSVIDVVELLEFDVADASSDVGSMVAFFGCR